MAQEKFGRYIGSARHKQTLLESAQEIAGILKILTRWNINNPDKQKDTTEIKQGYEDILKQIKSIK